MLQSKTFLRGMGIVCIWLLAVASSSVSAGAATLWFYKGSTNAPGENMCASFAEGAFQKERVRGIKREGTTVSGFQGPFFAIATCVGKVVVVMVSADPGADGNALAKAIFETT